MIEVRIKCSTILIQSSTMLSTTANRCNAWRYYNLIAAIINCKFASKRLQHINYEVSNFLE